MAKGARRGGDSEVRRTEGLEWEWEVVLEEKIISNYPERGFQGGQTR